MGVVFQDSVLDSDFTGRENLRLHARLWRVPSAAERISALLDAVDLTDRADYGVRTYSGGMKRRLEIARALLGRPRVLFLDEPTLGLDPLVRNDLWRMIQELKAQQKVTVLVSTHYLEEAQGVCDRVAIIDHGQIISLDSPSRLVAGLGRHILELSVNGDLSRVLEALRRSAGIGEPMQLGTTVAAPSDLSPPGLNELAGQLRLSELGATTTTVRPSTLNDVFLHLTLRTEKAREGAPT
jgi:ABC-2 type transport system ATP-binding protein